MIRNAMLKDIDIVTDLILMASACLFEDVLKTSDHKAQKELLMQYYVTKDTKFYYKNIIVYEINNEVVGTLVAYKASDEDKLNAKMTTLINNDYVYEKETIEDTLYIDSLAVSERHQGKGISRKLIEYAIKNSKIDLSLVVEAYKLNVKAYYERIGFKVVESLTLFSTDVHLMLYTKHK